jgi:hypothetical protein
VILNHQRTLDFLQLKKHAGGSNLTSLPVCLGIMNFPDPTIKDGQLVCMDLEEPCLAHERAIAGQPPLLSNACVAIV